MAAKKLWMYAGLGLAAGVGLVMLVDSSEPETPKAGGSPLGKRVALLGDSLAVGLALPLRQLLLEGGAELLSIGQNGSRIQNWATRQDQLGGPSLVLVSLGTNDMLLPFPLAERPDLATFVASLRTRAPGARIVWITPPTMPFPDKGVRAMLEGSGTEFFRSEGLVIPRGPDKIHPTAAGYAGWAGALVKWLTKGVGSMSGVRFSGSRRPVVG